MASAAHPDTDISGSISGFERTMITVAVMLATLMQILDTTIANVALPHMQTSLGATSESVSWVLTSYIVASAVAIPITGWLSDRLGRRRLYLGAVIGFTAASVLCAIATSLPEMVVFRVLQGIAGAFILPLAQAVMFDINPPEKHARAMTVFGAGVVIAPILGPVIGGWLTEYFNWRWVFLINLPLGILCTVMLLRFLPKGDKTKRRFDLFGFALLAIAVSSLQMMFDRGEQQDWFQSWEIWVECGLSVSAFWMFLVHLFTGRSPLFDPQMFRDRNFTTGLLFSVTSGVVMMAGLALLPPLLQRVLGHSVLDSGLLTAPRGVGTFLAMIIAGRLAHKVDPRLLILIGTGLMALSLWQMAGFTLDMDSRPIIVSGLVQGLGMGLTWVPLNILAFDTLAPRYRTSAASMITLGRSLGGSIGISMMVSLLARNLQTSHADLAAQITPAATPLIEPSVLSLFGGSGDAVMMMLDAEINRQAAMIAYIDDFYVMMFITFLSMPLVLLLRKPRPKTPGAEPQMVVE